MSEFAMNSGPLWNTLGPSLLALRGLRLHYHHLSSATAALIFLYITYFFLTCAASHVCATCWGAVSGIWQSACGASLCSWCGGHRPSERRAATVQSALCVVCCV